MRVLVTGCFDIIHPGHIFLFQEASKFGDVYVIVARDSTVKRLKKEYPIIPESQRLEVVQAIKYVKKAVLGNVGENFLDKALSLKPDLILLGPNQNFSIPDLIQLIARQTDRQIEVKRIEKFYDKYELNSSTAIKEKICKILKNL